MSCGETCTKPTSYILSFSFIHKPLLQLEVVSSPLKPTSFSCMACIIYCETNKNEKACNIPSSPLHSLFASPRNVTFKPYSRSKYRAIINRLSTLFLLICPLWEKHSQLASTKGCPFFLERCYCSSICIYCVEFLLRRLPSVGSNSVSWQSRNWDVT